KIPIRKLISVGVLLASARLLAAGAIITFDAPGAGTGPFQGTEAVGINPMGAITGPYIDASNVSHGFVRAPNGSITSFDPSGSINTQPQGINPMGAITGSYADASIVVHGFVRAPNGNISSFDVVGAGTSPGQGTLAQDINPAGA